MQVIRLGDTGSAIRVTIYDENGAIEDISTATSKQILFRRPDGTSGSWSPTLTTDGTDGKMHYVLIAGDINQVGRWEIQGYVSGTSTLFSTVDEFFVANNIAVPS